MIVKRMDSLFSLLVYTFLFFFVILGFKSSLLYFQFQPAFYFDMHFLHDFLEYPGGLGDMFSLFIFQFFFNNILGSLLFASVLMSIVLSMCGIFKYLFSTPLPLIVALIPLCFLIILYNGYNVPLAVSIKFAIVLLCAYAYSKGTTAARVMFIITLPVLYWILGGWFSLYLIIVIMSIHLVSHWSIFTLLFPTLFVLMYGISAYLSARFLFHVPMREALLYIVPTKYYYQPHHFKTTLLFYMLFISVPFLIFIWRTGLIIVTRFKSQKIKMQGPFIRVIDMALGIIMLCLSMIFSFQPDQKRKIYINNLADNSQWDKVLTESRKMHSYDRIVEFQTNRALYFTGRLLNTLFSIEHPHGVNGLFVDRFMGSQIALHASDLYFDLAHNNAAQAMAYEYNTKFRYDPRVLKRLALTNAINGHYSRTEIFLKLLEKSIIHKAWAKQHYRLMDANRILEIPGIEKKRQLKPTTDFFLHSQSPNIDLASLLKANSNNKMAFEYLMAYYLLECKLLNIAKHINKLKQFDYKFVPFNIEEAAIMYQSAAERMGNELIREIPFQRDQISRFVKFRKIIQENSSDKKRINQLLKKEFGDTFWYYLVSGGGTRTDTMKKRKMESVF